MTEEQGKDQQGKTGGSEPRKGMNFYWVYAAIAMVLIGMMIFNSGSEGRETDYLKFKELASKGFIEKVEYNGVSARVYLNQAGRDSLKSELGEQPATRGFSRSSDFWFSIPPGEDFIKEINQFGEQYAFAVRYLPPNEAAQSLIWWIVAIGIMIFAWVFIMRRMGGAGGPGGQIFNIGKSKAQLFEKGKGVQVTFNDVAGLEGAKEEIQEIVDFLKNPKKYTELGAKIPKGALLVGPPGTGKTLLAKAVAGEAQVPFFSLSGSDFVEMFVGVGASRVRDLFRQAKEKAPAIIFIDEIDAIGRARSKNINFGSNDERENTLNQLLTEMDGFATNSGIIILAATNRADILDKALLRAGRFDRQIYVDMPDMKERVQIFNVHLRNVKKDDSVDVEFLARQTPGFSGADIANICNEAALIAARKGNTTVGRQDFLDAVDRIIGGLEKKNKIITPEEKRTIAYHESGHAMVSWLLEHASPLVKVTIVPRGRSLGAAWYLPEERQLNTTEQIMDEMCAALGGRAAEEVAIGKISTGALSDLEKVTKQAYAMVSIFGLNKKIGNRSYYDSTGESQFTKPYSDETARIIDEEVSKIIEKAYEKAKDLLTRNREKLDGLASKLLEREVIFKDDLVEVLGPRQWEDRQPELQPVTASATPPHLS
ncbi:MAG: ATP-dependent zinc metalloprotease FtsH [Flavobacteriales bacterium]|jgi:ATP-dependent metalloprotease FtsH